MRSLVRLVSLLSPFLAQVFLSIFLGVATIASGIGLLGTSAHLIASAALHPDISVLQVSIVGVRFFGISRSVFRYLERLVSHSVNFKLLAGLRIWFYQTIEPLSPARLSDYKSGDILQRVVADVDYLENFYIRVVSPPIVACVIAVGTSLFIGRYNLVFGWLLAGGLCLGGFGFPLIAYYWNRGTGRKIIQARSALGELILDGLQGSADIQLFNRGNWYINRINNLSEFYGSLQQKENWRRGISDAINIMIVNLTLWVIMLYAIPQVGNFSLSGINFAVIALVILASFEAVNPLGLAAHYLGASLQCARRLFSLEDIEPAVIEKKYSVTQVNNINLEVKNLGFRYSGSNIDNLKNINLTLSPGEKLAILGANGSGKSTLINLLMRFWNYEEGTICLGGVELRDLSIATTRDVFSLVSPSTYIFNDTLRKNLFLADETVSDDDLIRVLNQVKLGGWLATLPDGLDTWVGENGVRMSGGERQRLALSRALLRHSPFMLMDEPTSNLDAGTEKEIIDLVLELSSGCSLIWISHSLAGMKDMDHIIVLEEGEIIEQGEHFDLVSRGGIYSRMWNLYSGTLKE